MLKITALPDCVYPGADWPVSVKEDVKKGVCADSSIGLTLPPYFSMIE
jgi:hypothetical protein